MTRRIERVSALLQEELGGIIGTGLSDPRLHRLITVTGVRVSADLEHATIAVSILGEDVERGAALRALETAKGYIRKQLAPRLQLRHVPDLHFTLDTTAEEASRVLAAMDRAKAERPDAGAP